MVAIIVYYTLNSLDVAFPFCTETKCVIVRLVVKWHIVEIRGTDPEHLRGQSCSGHRIKPFGEKVR